MTAEIIDGQKLANAIIAEIAVGSADLRRPPGLAVVLVGADSAGRFNADSKMKRAREINFHPEVLSLAETASEAEIVMAVGSLNRRDDIDAILIQLPLPPHINTPRVLAAVDPRKDIDGLHPLNAGLLFQGGQGFAPCTPLACIKMIKSVVPDLTGAHAVVLGASYFMGKPMAALLLAEQAIVTQVHGQPGDIPCLCRGADILVSAVDQPSLVRSSWVKPGAVVIDAGGSRVPKPGGGLRLVGDVAFDEAIAVAGAINPVPGAVGPMTIACILENTLAASRARQAGDRQSKFAWPPSTGIVAPEM